MNRIPTWRCKTHSALLLVAVGTDARTVAAHEAAAALLGRIVHVCERFWRATDRRFRFPILGSIAVRLTWLCKSPGLTQALPLHVRALHTTCAHSALLLHAAHHCHSGACASISLSCSRWRCLGCCRLAACAKCQSSNDHLVDVDQHLDDWRRSESPRQAVRIQDLPVLQQSRLVSRFSRRTVRDGVGESDLQGRIGVFQGL